MEIPDPETVMGMADLPMMWDTGWGLMFTRAPKGMCPWGEAKCDKECQPQRGCLLFREQEKEDPTTGHGSRGAHTRIVGA